MHKGEVDLAREEAEKAVREPMDNPQGHLAMAQVYLETKKFDKAMEQVDIAMAKFPQFVGVYKMKGEILTAQGKFDLAAQTFEKGKKIDPNDPSLIAEIGDLQIEQKRPDKGLEYIEKALKQSPDNVHFQSLRAKALWRMGKVEEAKEEFKKIIEKNPHRIESIEKLAAIYRMQKNEKELFKLIDDSIQKNTSKFVLSRLYYLRMECDDEYGRPEESLRDGEKLLSLNPDYYGLYPSLGELYALRGNHTRAKELAKMFLEKAPEPRICGDFINYAIVYKILGDYDKALEYCRKGKWGSYDYEVYLEMGSIYIDKKDYKSARENLQKVLNMGNNPRREEAAKLLKKIENLD